MGDKTAGLEESRADRVYLGTVTEIHSTYEGARLAILQPLIRSDWSGNDWEGALRDGEEEFPDRGKVFWWDVPDSVEDGSLWQFHAELHPTYDPPEKPEKYQAVSPVPPVEVVDMRRHWSEAKVRRQFTGEGAYLHDEPIVPDVMIWFEKETWIGPVRIERVKPHLWKIADSEDLSRLECHEVSSALLRPMKVEGRRRIFLSPSLEAGRRLGFRNWMPDDQLASSVLSRIRRLDQAAFEALNTTYRAFDSYQVVLKTAGLEGLDREREEARQKRVVELRQIISENEKLLKEAAEMVLSTPSVQEEVTNRKKQIYEEVRRQEQEKVATELRDRREELVRVSAEIEDSAVKLSDMRREIEAKNAEIDALAGELDRATERFKADLSRRLRELSESPEQAFAEVAMLRALVGPVVGESAASNGDSAQVAPPPESGAKLPNGREATPSPAAPLIHAPPTHPGPEAPTIGDARDVLKRIRDTFKREGLSPTLGVHIHCGFLAGAVPIIAGTRAFNSLAAYASAVAGGRLLWVPVPGSAFEPQDLLGRYDPATGTLVPHPGGLLNALLEARESDQTSVVVLDGFNRAPVESYLLPLLQCYSDGWGGSGRRSIPVAPAGLVRGPEPYPGITRVAWSPNLLMAVIPSDANGTFPMSPSVWNHMVLIDADGASYPTTAPEGGQEPVQSAARELWGKWRDATRATDLGPAHGAIEPFGDGTSRSVPGASIATRVYAAGRVSRLTEAAAVELAIKAALLPRSTDPATVHAEAITRLGIDAEEAEAIHTIASGLAG
jgi:hypothetical protein